MKAFIAVTLLVISTGAISEAPPKPYPHPKYQPNGAASLAILPQPNKVRRKARGAEVRGSSGDCPTVLIGSVQLNPDTNRPSEIRSFSSSVNVDGDIVVSCR